jgi:hypothetical protein
MTEEQVTKIGMAFELKDGAVLVISDEIVKEIATKIIMNGILTDKVVLTVNKDDNITKAQQLHEILNKEKGMPPELRIQYYEQILELYKTSGASFTTEEVDKPKK